MITLVLVAVITAVALGIAAFVNKRRPDAPTTPQFAVPQQLDRNDFEGADSDWVLVLFSSASCLSCADTRAVIEPVRTSEVFVTEIEFDTHRDIHERYGIDGVPALVLADSQGVVHWSFLGIPPRQAIAEMLDAAGVVPPESGTGVDLP